MRRSYWSSWRPGKGCSCWLRWRRACLVPLVGCGGRGCWMGGCAVERRRRVRCGSLRLGWVREMEACSLVLVARRRFRRGVLRFRPMCWLVAGQGLRSLAMVGEVLRLLVEVAEALHWLVVEARALQSLEEEARVPRCLVEE